MQQSAEKTIIRVSTEDPAVVEVHKIDGPVDTEEQRNIEGSTDDLKTINYREDGESTRFF